MVWGVEVFKGVELNGGVTSKWECGSFKSGVTSKLWGGLMKTF